MENKNDFVYLDGAMGTMLQQSLLQLGERPEVLNITHPHEITQIHKSYIDAGSDIVYANTFGANAHKLEGCGYSVEEIIAAGIRNAKAACEGSDARVALDIGPLGEMLEPSGVLCFEDAYALFAQMVKAGVEAGADLIVFETMTDLYEMKAGVLAAKENSELPVFVTMTFEENKRTFTGCSIEAFALTAEGLGCDAIGINCSLGPDEILPIATTLSQHTSLPLIVKPNAGLPDPETNMYVMTAEAFGPAMAQMAQLGIKYLGGCCGTTEAYIRELVKHTASIPYEKKSNETIAAICTPTKTVTMDDVRVIGERINPTGKKRFKQALIDGDMDYILGQAMEQVEAGAHILDVNVGLPDIDEVAVMRRTVKALQSVVDVPLQIDSSDPEAIEAGLRVVNGKAIVNSVNGEQASMDRILPIVKKYGAAVVGLTLDENGIAQTAQGRFAVAQKILNEALKYGIPKEDVYIDCLTLTVSSEQQAAQVTLDAMELVKKRLGLKLVLGVSNISFGLPNRALINRSFLLLAMSKGLDLAIINPNSDPMMDAVFAYRVLYCKDIDADDYIARYVNETPHAAPSVVADAGAPDMELSHAVQKGLKEEVRRLTMRELQTKSETEVIDRILIPALDEVGKNFEAGSIFLPQLIKAATASQAAFELIKEKIAESGEEQISKGKILLATVKGDIHDIGKNIVKVILENYGYQIVDLGRDVPPERVVETAIAQDIKLIGLSALMTTTLVTMEQTIRELRESGHDCKVMVGGAVLTESYAHKIGADYYAKDANEGVDIARRVLG